MRTTMKPKVGRSLPLSTHCAKKTCASTASDEIDSTDDIVVVCVKFSRYYDKAKGTLEWSLRHRQTHAKLARRNVKFEDIIQGADQRPT